MSKTIVYILAIVFMCISVIAPSVEVLMELEDAVAILDGENYTEAPTQEQMLTETQEEETTDQGPGVLPTVLPKDEEFVDVENEADIVEDEEPDEEESDAKLTEELSDEDALDEDLEEELEGEVEVEEESEEYEELPEYDDYYEDEEESDFDISDYYMYIGGALIIIGGIVFLLLNKPKKPQQKVMPPPAQQKHAIKRTVVSQKRVPRKPIIIKHNVRPPLKLIDFVVGQMKQAIPESEIRKTLFKAKWSKLIIESAFLEAKKKLEEKPVTHEDIMEPKLFDYIKQQRVDGLPEKEIRKSLLTLGYSKEVIDATFLKYYELFPEHKETKKKKKEDEIEEEGLEELEEVEEGK